MTRLFVYFLIGLAGCGGGGSGLLVSGNRDGGADAGHSLAGEVPLKHRPMAIACGASGVPDDNCMQDSDCASGGVCSCAGNTFAPQLHPSANTCVASNCRVDSDCGPGGYCSPTVSAGCGSFYGVQGYDCHTPADSCINDADCTPASGGYCAFAPEVGHWACYTGECAG